MDRAAGNGPRPPWPRARHAGSDGVFTPYRGAVFATGSASISFNENLPMWFYVDRAGEIVLLERKVGYMERGRREEGAAATRSRMSMSIYHRLYICRLASCSTTDREAIRGGIDVVDKGERWTESFRPDAFLGTEERVPVLLSHEEERGPVGWVAQRTVHNGWHIASFQLDHGRTHSAIALDRLRIGTPVSIGFTKLRHDPTLAKLYVKQHTLARLDELSILAPNEIPAYRGAKITQILEMPKPSLARADRSAAGEVIQGGELIVRRGIGQVLGVR